MSVFRYGECVVYNGGMQKGAFRHWTYAVVCVGIPLVFTYLLLAFSPAYLYAQATPETGKDVSLGTSTASDTLSFSTNTFSVSPVVSNEKAKPRDIIKKELLVTNNTDERLDVYISVENIDPTAGAQETMSPGVADLSISLANWIEITRGVIELSPRESRKIPFLIHVNLSAKPGSYFARIQFGEGSRRIDAEAKAPEEGTGMLLNVEVLDDAKERLQLGNFTADKSIVTGEQVGFSYLLENVGNRNIAPRGSIRIFNRNGEEVGSVPLNAQGEGITPENKKQLAAAWDATGRFGKYKAFLDLEYGEQQLASVQDTVYFWVFPWKEILFSLMGIGLLGVIGTFIIHTRSVARPIHHTAAPMSEENMRTPHHISSSPAFQPMAAVLPSSSTYQLPVSPPGGAVVLGARGSGTRVGTPSSTGKKSVVAPPRRAQTSVTVSGNTIALARKR